jgi:hypothetical protein
LSQENNIPLKDLGNLCLEFDALVLKLNKDAIVFFKEIWCGSMTKHIFQALTSGNFSQHHISG